MGSDDEDLARALSEWRRTGAPADAERVERASAKTTAPPMPALSGDAFHAAWLERATKATASDLVPLLATLAQHLPLRAFGELDATTASRRVRAALARENATMGDADRGRFISLSARLEALGAFGPDPRTTKALVEYLRRSPLSGILEGAVAIATYGPIFDLVVEMRDVSVLPALEAMLSNPAHPYYETALPRVLQALRNLGSASPREAPTPRDVSELFELVVRDFADNAPRAVLADRWLELGDTRGEFVNLQLRYGRGEASKKDMQRMYDLQRDCEKDWLGDLVVLTRDRIYRRGFLEECALAHYATGTPERWAAAAADPRLGTVRRLERGSATDDVYRLFLTSPALRNLDERYRALFEV